MERGRWRGAHVPLATLASSLLAVAPPALVLVAAAAPLSAAQTFVPPLGGALDGALEGALAASLATPRTLAEIHTLLEGLEGQAFQDRVAELIATQPGPTVQALLLRAGRGAPPGLAGARAERRSTRRGEALDWIRSDLTDDSLRQGLWIAQMRDLMTPRGAESPEDEELLCATLTVSAELARYDLAREVAANLDGPRSPRVRETARSALFALYGRRFSDRQAFDQAWQHLAGRGKAGLDLEALTALHRRNDELERRLLEHELERAGAVLASAHPGLRAQVAALVGRGVGLRSIQAADAIALLLERVTLETDPRAFHATLGALLELVQGLGHDAEAVVSLRARLTDPEVLGRLQLADSIVDALARLPWGPEGEGTDHRTAITLCARLIGELARWDRPVDYDRLSMALGGLQALCDRSNLTPGEIVEQTRLASGPVLDLLTRPEVPLQARLDAAGIVYLLMDRAELPRVLSVLEDTDSVRLQLALLGSVGELARGRGLEPGSPVTQRLVGFLQEAAGAEDVDLRRRALEVLAGEDLAPVLAGRPAGLAESLVVGLAGETVPALQTVHLGLLARLAPDPALAGRILALEGFDALLDGPRRRLDEALTTLRALVVGDVEATVAAARRMVRDLRTEPGPPPGAPSPEARHAAALALIGDLGPRAAELDPEDHREVITWALYLRRVFGDPAGGPEELAPLLGQLVEIHLARVGEGPGHAYEWALFSADLHLRQPQEISRATVLARFAEGLAAAEGPLVADLLHRARARFLAAAGEAATALPDHLALLFPDGASRPRSQPELLGLGDLRRAAEALATAPGPDGAARAARVGLVVVSHPDWTQAPKGSREADLQALVERARASGEAALRGEVLALFEELPPLFEEEDYAGGENGSYPGRVYDGLLSSRQAHQGWIERLATLRAGATPDGEGDPQPPAGEGDGEDPAPDRPPGEGDPPGSEAGG